MKSLTTALFAVLSFFGVACTLNQEPKSDQLPTDVELHLVGQVLLPDGLGSRGVELRIDVETDGNEPHNVWVLFDEQGHFDHSFRGKLTNLEVVTALNSELYALTAEELSRVNQAGQVDVGLIDLRDRLDRHRLMLRAADGAPQGDVKVAMWKGLPHVGPQGEPVSLGSRQFPTVALGNQTEWLVQLKANSIYFLIERPVGPGRGREWRSGRQQLFGPFDSDTIPDELIID
jgi:hypothetical protein